jgi:hypothetical protein
VTSLVLAGLIAGSAVCGYVARVLVERFIERRRERALRALGGKLPDWEVHALELEARAHLAVSTMINLDTAVAAAQMLRREADTTRKRGRRRDREWR